MSQINRKGEGSTKYIPKIVELNRDIRKTTSQLSKARQDLGLLRGLVREFSTLFFDKLQLDAAFSQDFEEDMDQNVIRVILGRIKTAMQYFNGENAPISQLELKKEASSFRFQFYLSRKHAKQHLCKITDQLLEIQRTSEGMATMIRRFEDDNNLLKADIEMLRNNPGKEYIENNGKHTWAKLSGINLMTRAEKRSSVYSQRRMSSINMRRMSLVSTKSHSPNSTAPGYSYDYNGAQFPGSFGSNPQHDRASLTYPQSNIATRPRSMHINLDHRMSTVAVRRRSGALSDSDVSGDGSIASTNTSLSTHSFAKPSYVNHQMGYPNLIS